MKVKDIDALREQISHDPREAFTKHQVWLFVSEHNKTTPTFDAVPKSVLEDIKSAIENYKLSDDEKIEMDEDSIKWGLSIAYDIVDRRTHD